MIQDVWPFHRLHNNMHFDKTWIMWVRWLTKHVSHDMTLVTRSHARALVASVVENFFFFWKCQVCLVGCGTWPNFVSSNDPNEKMLYWFMIKFQTLFNRIYSVEDTLPEWSKGVDPSSTSASCMGSNPIGVIVHTNCQSTYVPNDSPWNNSLAQFKCRGVYRSLVRWRIPLECREQERVTERVRESQRESERARQGINEKERVRECQGQ